MEKNLILEILHYLKMTLLMIIVFLSLVMFFRKLTGKANALKYQGIVEVQNGSGIP
ncbi:MAG TPA: hypothetical protein P5050_10240 [Bacteroidia bacterium]|nr:hypothetical protein [Bacteroidia bacterium]HRS59589.1 hypothetical protein [Bacteroidia bacterium]HRU67622.1 hypothetical protein [Bacteroidia bacterium]